MLECNLDGHPANQWLLFLPVQVVYLSGYLSRQKCRKKEKRGSGKEGMSTVAARASTGGPADQPRRYGWLGS